MTRPQPLDRWTDQVRMAFPNLSRPQATVLALYSFGMILAKRCGLSSVVTALVPVLCVVSTPSAPASRSSTSRLPPSRATTRRTRRHHLFRPAAGLDPPGLEVHPLRLGLGCHQLGRLLDGLVDRGRLPRPGHPRGLEDPAANVPHPWKPEWLALLRLFSGLVPPGYTVIVMADRAVCPLALPGDSGPGLASRAADHQAEQIPQARLEGGRPGRGPGAAAGLPMARPRVAFPRKAEQRLECTLLACWEEGCEGPWFLVTDLAPDQAEGLWYGMRSWIEGGYKLLKSGGWQWQATRMTDRIGRSGCGWSWRWRPVMCWRWAGRPTRRRSPRPRSRSPWPIGPGVHRAAAGIDRSWQGPAAPPQCPGRSDYGAATATATHRDQGAPGQRVPARLGRLVECAGRRSCVTCGSPPPLGGGQGGGHPQDKASAELIFGSPPCPHS